MMGEGFVPQPAVSIVIPVKGINHYIQEAIPRILALDYDNFEILIFPDHPGEETFPRTRIIATGPVAPAEKRDLALRHAKGEILAFLDDDAFPRTDWLREAVRHFADPQVGAVGGPAVTPEADDLWQKASGAVYASKMGGGIYTYRYVPERLNEVDDFPSVNLLVRRDLFEALGGFDSQYWPGEDTKLCLDIVSAGKKIIYDPEVFVWHHRRPLFRDHLRQVARYALHRGYFWKVLPQTSRRLSYALPSLFVGGMVVGAPLAWVHLSFGWLYAAVLGLYGLGLLVSGVNAGFAQRRAMVGLLTIPGLFLTHCTYGIYFARGLLAKELKR